MVGVWYGVAGEVFCVRYCKGVDGVFFGDVVLYVMLVVGVFGPVQV
jgi:hypothetical protein